MSFPRLLLSAGTSGGTNETISGIGLSFGGGTPDAGIYLKRLKHTVTRVLTKGNTDYGNASVKVTVPYDRITIVHTFVGFVDVLSQSVTRSSSSTPQETTNCDLIENAIMYEDSVLSFDYKYFAPDDIGASNPSNGLELRQGLATAATWTYAIEDGEPKTTTFWMIKNISVLDNQNNTSRVTFTFESVKAQEDLTSLITGIVI